MKTQPDTNHLLSPYALGQCLAMAANVAAGQTLTEIEKVLENGISITDLNQYFYTLRGMEKIIRNASLLR